MGSRPFFGRGRSRRSGGVPVIQLFLWAIAAVSLTLFLYNFFWSNSGHQAKQAVRQFYELEQAGNYGSAWELFHPQMQEKFSKDAYIQRRAHIFMQQLGAETFAFEIREVDSIGTWSMSEGAPAIADVYRVEVVQSYQTIFGQMQIIQPMYAAQESGGWKLLWSY